VTHLYHTSGHRAPVWPTSAFRVDGTDSPCPTFRTTVHRAARHGNHRAHHHSTFAPEEVLVKMHQEHAADSDMVEAN